MSELQQECPPCPKKQHGFAVYAPHQGGGTEKACRGVPHSDTSERQLAFQVTFADENGIVHGRETRDTWRLVLINQTPNRRSRCWKARTARRKSIRRKAGQLTSEK